MREKDCTQKNTVNKHTIRSPHRDKAHNKLRINDTLFHNISLHDFHKKNKRRQLKNIYFRFGCVVDCSSNGFAPNQLRKRPIGVACNERFSTAFAALFCNVGVRTVA
jgi:hypothetical protein